MNDGASAILHELKRTAPRHTQVFASYPPFASVFEACPRFVAFIEMESQKGVPISEGAYSPMLDAIWARRLMPVSPLV